MTIQEIMHQAQTLSVTDQVRLVIQLMQLIESTLQPETPAKSSVDASASSTVASAGIIAELIENPVAFEGSPLKRSDERFLS